MKTLLGLVSVFFLSISLSASANPYSYYGERIYPPFPDYRSTNPAKILEDGLNRMRTFLEQGGADDPAKLYTFLQDQVAPYFDFERMAAWVSRPYYQQMSERQKTVFRNRLQENFLRTLAMQIGTFREPQPRIDFLQPRRTGPNQMEISARVLPSKGYPIRLTFRLWRGPQGWKVIDAAANGTSAMRYYRQRFIKQIRYSGLKGIEP